MLFNESIKENIKFGNLDATDEQVRTVATQANAMGFIMQNDDDVSSAAVQERIKSTFERVARAQIPNAASFPNFSGIPQLVENQSVTFKELALICDVMPYLSATGLQQLESRFRNFLDAVSQKAQ